MEDLKKSPSARAGEWLSTGTLARVAGVLYLVVAVCGGFGEYVRSTVRVPGDAAATAAKVAQSAGLLRLGLASDLLAFMCFLGVGLVLYLVLASTDARVALAMLVVNAISVAMQAINLLNQAGAVLIATSATYAPAVTAPATQMQAALLLDLQHQGYLIAQVFFGLFLLPLGYLVFRSGLFPKALGIILMVGCGGYLGGVVASYLTPALDSGAATYFGLVGGLAELIFLLWLLAVGARVSKPGAGASRSASRVEVIR